MPVMEGKAMLFKEFAQVDAFPICLATKRPPGDHPDGQAPGPHLRRDSASRTSPLPAVSRSRRRSRRRLDIPVFHDDQHGTAVVVMAALFNSLKIIGKPIQDLRGPVLGTGAAGIACTKMMQESGITQIIGCDRKGRDLDRTARTTPTSRAVRTSRSGSPENTQPRAGLWVGPNEVIEGFCDLFIGLSGPGVWSRRPPCRRTTTRSSSRWPTPPPRSCPRRPSRMCGSWRRAARDYPNRSTTSSLPRHLPRRPRRRRPRITEEMKTRRGEGDRRGRHGRRPGRGYASSPRSSIATSPRRWPARWSRRPRPRASPGSRRRPAPTRSSPRTSSRPRRQVSAPVGEG